MTTQAHTYKQDDALKVPTWRCHDCCGVGTLEASGDKRRITWPCSTCNGTGALPVAKEKL